MYFQRLGRDVVNSLVPFHSHPALLDSVYLSQSTALSSPRPLSWAVYLEPASPVNPQSFDVTMSKFYPTYRIGLWPGTFPQIVLYLNMPRINYLVESTPDSESCSCLVWIEYSASHSICRTPNHPKKCKNPYGQSNLEQKQYTILEEIQPNWFQIML